jgi:hypothetical protein
MTLNAAPIVGERLLQSKTVDERTPLIISDAKLRTVIVDSLKTPAERLITEAVVFDLKRA